jgi:diketogulonate reductase-like aldo/keto reductase
MYGNKNLLFDIVDNKRGVQIGSKVHRRMHPGLLLDSLRKTGVGRFHQVFLHHPLPLHMWGDLEAAWQEGLVAEFGLSNVNLLTLQKLLLVAGVKPHLVQGELHPFLPDLDFTLALIQFCRDQGIVFEAHSVLA